MPDLAVPPPNALYPQPPQQQGALSGNPTQLLDLIGTLTKNQMLQNELKARTAIGQAYQGALTPGGLDPEKLTAGLRNPDAAWGLPEALTRQLQQQGQQFSNLSSQDAAARAVIGTLPANASDEDLRHYAVTLSRAGVPPAIVSGHVDALMAKKGRERGDAITTLKNTAIGPAGISQRLPGPPGPSGEQQSISVGEANRYPGGMPIGQPPGEAELQGASAGRAAVLQGSGATTAQYHADLENLKQLGRATTLSGPTSEIEKRLAQVAARLGLPSWVTAKSLSSAEEFDKIAATLAIRQTAAFHNSDAGLHMNVTANPALNTSALGREAVIDMLHGNQDAVDRLREMWLNARLPGNRFDSFVNDASKLVDPRLFQFNRLSRQGQQKFYDELDPADRRAFEAKYVEAVKRGWVKRAKPPPAPGE